MPAGTYTLTIAGIGENGAATGDLDINGDLTITGEAAATTIVDANDLDQLFDIRSAATTVEINPDATAASVRLSERSTVDRLISVRRQVSSAATIGAV